MDKNKLSVKIISNFIFFATILIIIFTRSFVGLKIFGYRLGELMAGFGLFATIIFITYILAFQNKKFKFFPTSSYIVLISIFLLTVFISSGNFLNLYTYKSSSFLWMIGYVFIGYLFFEIITFNKFHIIVLSFTPLIIYVLNSGNYPNIVIDFFKKYSDKFQFTKGSDVLMALLFCLFLLNGKFKKDMTYINFTNLLSFLLLPLFLTLSRASFFSCLIFIILINLNFKKVILNNRKKYLTYLFISFLLFLISSIRLAALPEIELRSEEPVIVKVVQDSVSEVAQRKNTFQFLGFYMCEDRICAKDNTLDWRLDIWNDLVKDQINKQKILFGFGFNEMFEIMKDPQAPGRLGREGLNEHVHNHIFTVLGRMGLLGLAAYILFQVKLIGRLDLEFLIFFIPLFLLSMIDTTMESIQFPYLYYFLISYFKISD